MKQTTPSMEEIIKVLDLTLLTKPQNFSVIVPTTGYTADLLSCVMANGMRQGIWVTLQAHANIVAVSALLDLSAVIITEGAMPDQNTIEKANQEGVVLFSTPKPSFHVVGKLWEMGLRAE